MKKYFNTKKEKITVELCNGEYKVHNVPATAGKEGYEFELESLFAIREYLDRKGLKEIDFRKVKHFTLR